MSAIESCRSAALAVMSSAARIAATAHRLQLLPHRHCPKCQGAAAKDWLASGARPTCSRSAYFHLVFTLPAEDRPDRLPEQGMVYDLLFRTFVETLLTIAPIQSISAPASGITACSILGARR